MNMLTDWQILCTTATQTA